MNKRFFNQQNLTRRLRMLFVLFAMLLLPLGAWAEDYPLIVAGVQVTDENATGITGTGITTGTVSFTPASGDNPATLTLNSATITGDITYSGTEDLTIAFSGTTNAVSTSENYAIQYVGSDSELPNLAFSLTNGSTTGSLNLSSENCVISGFSDVDFGNLNLASASAQGVYYDSSEYGYHMAGYGGNPNNLTITTETYHPIWIYDPSLGQEASHTQLNSNKLSVAFGEGTISFDGNHTITMNNVDFNYMDNTLIVVGPGMEELTVNLVGTSTVISGSIFLSLWATTPLTFTTDESNPGSLTAPTIVNWNNENGQITYQNGLVFNFDESTYKGTISTTGDRLKIGDISINATGDITGDGITGTVHFDTSNNTLTLTGATIGEEIVSNVGTLTIDLTGSNSINSISATGNATALAFTGTSTATLNLSNSDGVISGFSSVNTGDFNLLSNSTPGIHYSGDKKALVNYDNYNAGEVTLTHAEVYPLWIGNIQVTGNNETSITGEGITKYNDGAGSITFDPDNNLLTFDGVSLYVTNNRYIVSGLEYLSIKIKGNNYFNSDPYLTSDALVSTIEGASLTFSAEGDDPRLEMLVSRDPFSSFTVNYDKTYSYINTGQGLTDIYALKAPTVSLVDNVPTINSAGINDNGENINYYYTIDCEGTEYDIAETLIENGSTTLELSKPCIVTAYAKYTFGNQKTTQSSVNTGKYFGPAENPMRLVYEAEPVDFVLAPAIEEGDGIIINDIEANVTYSSTTGKVSSSTLGRNGAIVSLGYVDANNKTTILLNNSFDMNFDVVPPTATITCDKGQNDPYLNTQVITLSQTAIDGYNTKIFYAWETGETEVNVPTDTFEQPGTEYNSETTIHPQVGKLKAWVGYHLGDNEYLNSEVTTLEITAVKTDFTDAVVSCPTSAAYTGSAINPEITVKASAQAENNLVKDEDYTVSYKKVGEGEALTDVTSMVDAGSYKIIITGAGNYVGSISKDFEIVRASVDWNATGWTSPEAKTDLTFTNEAKDLITGATVPDGVTVNYCYKYSTSEFDEQARSELPDPANWTTTVPQGTNAGYYAVFYKVEESANYEGWGPCEVALQTSIAKAAISEVVVNITGWTYGGYDEETNAPSVTEASNPGNGEVTYLYKENKDGANFSGDVPTAVGAYIVQATVPETDNYLSQTGTATFSITAKSITDEMVTLSPTSFVYSGVAQTPTVTVKDGETPLTQAENAEAEGDYTVAFSNNTNAALSTAETAPTVTITGKGNYTGTATKTFTIAAKDLASATVTVDPNQTYTYTGSAITPNVSSVSIKLTEGADAATNLTSDDYTVTGYANNTDAALATAVTNAPTVTITGKGNFTGTATGTFTIDQANLGDVTIAEIGNQTYTGSQITPAVTVTFNDAAVSTEDYNVVYGENTNAGENAGTVTLTSQNKNFSTTSTKGATFTIVAKTLTADMVISVASVTYTGSAVEPELTIRDGDLDLEKGTDYTVIYSDNVSAGTNTAKATITGKGNYTGSADKMFTINKAQLTVTADDKTYNVGDDITLTVTITGFVNGETKTVLTTQPTASYGTADVTKPGSYEITASGGVAQNYDFVYETGTLTINRVLDVSFASNTWATYCGTENLATPEGLQAYIVTAVGTSAVTTSAIDYIPANTAVLLKDVEGKAASANIVASAYEGETTTFPDNLLQGGVAVDVSTITGGTVYVLYKDMFKRATGGTIPANRGYLVVAPSSGNAPQLSITIGDDTTGIGTVGCDSVATDNDEWYTLDGQKLQQAPTQKGLYIKNGKKVVINKK